MGPVRLVPSDLSHLGVVEPSLLWVILHAAPPSKRDHGVRHRRGGGEEPDRLPVSREAVHALVADVRALASSCGVALLPGAVAWRALWTPRPRAFPPFVVHASRHGSFPLLRVRRLSSPRSAMGVSWLLMMRPAVSSAPPCRLPRCASSCSAWSSSLVVVRWPPVISDERVELASDSLGAA